MAEYIEREILLEHLRKDPLFDLVERYGITGVIQSIPAADVREVERGHIEEDENTYLWCSECGCNITLAAYEMPNGNLILRPNYCPNCGADMREES